MSLQDSISGTAVKQISHLSPERFRSEVQIEFIDREGGPVVVVGHAWGQSTRTHVRGVVMAAASAGKLPPGSTEKPHSRLHDAIAAFRQIHAAG